MIKKTSLIKLLLSTTLLINLYHGCAIAANSSPDLLGKKINPTSHTSLSGLFGGIQDWIMGFVGAIAVLFIVWAGIKYITSRGDSKQVESAKKTFRYSIIGLLFIICAELLYYIISGFINTIIG